ncbi:MAG: phosphoenolpyruvate carboxylase, partial [Alphaproteobacteria bacterium]
MKNVAELVERLSEHHARTRETPLFNPVFQLGLDLSRALEAGETDLANIESLVAELECESMQSRATRLRRLVAPVAPQSNRAALSASLAAPDFASLRATWERPHLHAVFTAHPTFLLTPVQSGAVAQAASSDDRIDKAVCVVSSSRPAITLDHEHECAIQAIANAQDARDSIVREVLEHASAQWPDDWRNLSPLPFRFASWVGYDMDGRTDIKWYTSIQYRLAEKARRLVRYVAALEAIDPAHGLLDQLRPALDYAGERAADFAADLSSPEALSDAANRLTADHPHKLLSLASLIAVLEEEAQASETPRAIELKTLAAAMRADGLGMGWIHFRVNSSQLHNAIRRRIDPD